MRRMGIAVLAAALLLTGCSALQELAALRHVTFGFDRVSGVRLAGVTLSAGSRFSSLGLADAMRLADAIAARQVPLELVAHVRAANPPENRVSARLAGLRWTLWVDQRQLLEGRLAAPIAIAPGESADVPLAVRFDLRSLEGGGARELYELALAIAGYGATTRDARFELVPTVDTALGPLTYPSPLVVRITRPD